MAYETECLRCGGTIIYNVTPGERATRDYPGSGPEIDVVGGDCECDDIAEDTYFALLKDAQDQREAEYDAWADAQYEAAREREWGWD